MYSDIQFKALLAAVVIRVLNGTGNPRMWSKELWRQPEGRIEPYLVWEMKDAKGWKRKNIGQVSQSEVATWFCIGQLYTPRFLN